MIGGNLNAQAAMKLMKNAMLIVNKKTFQNSYFVDAPFNKKTFSHNLIKSNRFLYVKIKDLQEIRDQHKAQGNLKVISKSCGFFMKQAWNDFKADYNIFRQIRSIPIEQRTQQQKYLYRKIKIDMIKFGPAFAIFNVPFGFPLFYIYLKLFPQLIPSWMMVDSIFEQILQRKKERQIASLKFYQKFDQTLRMAYLKEAIFKSNQSLEDMRRISCICYGDYTDGTDYLSEKLGIQFKNGVISPKLSLLILKNHLMAEINHDYELQEQFQALSTFEEKLFYKLEKQMQKLSDK